MAKRYTLDELETIEADFSALFEDATWSYLIVDNSVAVRKTLVNALKKAGCENVLEAKDGMDAIMKVRKIEGKTVIVTEISLPVMSGLVMQKQLREDKELQFTPVIFASSDSRKENIIGAIQGGAVAYLKKPFEPKVLVDKLAELKML